MARRNIFQPPPPPTPQGEPATADSRPRFPNTGAMSGVKSTLRDLSSNAVKELDPASIDDDGPRDRLPISDADVADLAESMRLHGQQVPIMVRPLPDAPGRYRIVYGRRRLRALKLIGMPAKALVRSLSDEQAILAQGQENSLRLDPSFIEKALFVAELADAGYDSAIILDALAIDKPMLSRMTKVARTIPPKVIKFVGPAHGIGRRRWEDLADLSRGHIIDLEDLADRLPRAVAEGSSDDRFAHLQEAAIKAITKEPSAQRASPALPITDDTGAVIGEVKVAPRALTIRLARNESSGFAEWMRENAEKEILRLYEVWKASVPSD
ncbi:plasmid partitioning protein RepB [Haematobacter massiliensis]|uniref:plasmid partitioning protein RepB n=1 Tax=Haematobacter massiliensis TaxID=195105 RepID=UPI00103AF98F|nr:plasmid partitioning protein RepB [Haematobacter massiliensis]QBJ26457.1 plasmid partitioning protein RepB [Haematobacter massiliensis]